MAYIGNSMNNINVKFSYNEFGLLLNEKNSFIGINLMTTKRIN